MSSSQATSVDLVSPLPPELLDMICEEVEDADILSLRLTCKLLYDVATMFFSPEVKVYLKRDSFERLIEISKHPIISQNVYELTYEPNVLNERSRESWEALLPAVSSDIDDLPMPPSPSSGTDRDWRAYRRYLLGLFRPIYNPYTKQKRDEAWNLYQDYVAEQDIIRDDGYGAQALQEAIARLPRLERVYMNHGSALWHGRGGRRDDPKNNPYHAALAISGGDIFHPPSGVLQMRSLMLAIHQAGLELHTLHVGDVNWKFLQQDEETIEKMKTVLRSVHSFGIQISVGHGENDIDIGPEIPECRPFLSNNKLHDFLRAAPDVSVLQIRFDWNKPFAPAEFKNIVHDFTWWRLRHLEFESIDTTEHDWLKFFERHASTLETLTFRSIRLLDGEWPDVLERMQQCLSLKSACVRHMLVGLNPVESWDLEPGGYESSKDMRVQGNRTRKAIEHFLVNGGTCPLRDEANYPQADYF